MNSEDERRSGQDDAPIIQRLRAVAAESKRSNPFLGRGELDQRFETLRAMEAEDPRRWLLEMEIARAKLRLGETDSAIEHYRRAYELMQAFRGALPAEEAIKTVFELGLAYMRQGENLNCAMNHTSESCLFPIRGGGVHIIKESSENAVRLFEEVLASAPPQTPLYLRSQWLLNLAYMTLGQHPAAVPPRYLIDAQLFQSAPGFPRFPEIAPQLGLASFDLSGGAVVDDFTGDGLLDVMVSTSDTTGPMHFYRNRGDGTFVDETSTVGLADHLGGLNMVQADYNNDGHVDVFVLRGGWWRSDGRHPNSLLRNNGDGTFTDVTFDAGLGEFEYPTQTASWSDYDNDGDLDLYVGNEYSEDTPAPCQLFRNNGDGTFTDVAALAGVRNERYTKGVIWGDYNNDRFPDLYVSNLGDKNRLYINHGDGTFTDSADRLGVARPFAGFATWFWDYDNDGALDLFAASYGDPRGGPDVADVVAGYLGLPHAAELDRLYRGTGRGRFEDVTEQVGLRQPTLPMGSNFGDLDNDGYLDFYLGTGYPQYDGLTPNVMYHNDAGQRFEDVTASGGFGHLQKGHGVAFADLDHDGDQDIFQQIGGAYAGDAFGNALFHNPGFGNRWIKIRLVGQRSNRSAIGARIRVDVVEGGRLRSIFRHVNSGGSFGCNPLRQEIGLGAAEKIQRLQIFWPTSGLTQTFEGVPMDRLLRIEEHESSFETVEITPFDLQTS